MVCQTMSSQRMNSVGILAGSGGSTDPARLIGPDSQNWKSRFPVCLDVVQGQEAAEAREPSLHRSAPLCSSDGPRPGCFQLCCSSGSFSDV